MLALVHCLLFVLSRSHRRRVQSQPARLDCQIPIAFWARAWFEETDTPNCSNCTGRNMRDSPPTKQAGTAYIQQITPKGPSENARTVSRRIRRAVMPKEGGTQRRVTDTGITSAMGRGECPDGPMSYTPVAVGAGGSPTTTAVRGAATVLARLPSMPHSTVAVGANVSGHLCAAHGVVGGNRQLRPHRRNRCSRGRRRCQYWQCFCAIGATGGSRCARPRRASAATNCPWPLPQGSTVLVSAVPPFDAAAVAEALSASAASETARRRRAAGTETHGAAGLPRQLCQGGTPCESRKCKLKAISPRHYLAVPTAQTMAHCSDCLL
jgi:hypothetical protein